VPEAKRPKIMARCHAQSVDIHDFTWPMREWMSLYEKMVSVTSSMILCASDLHIELMKVAGWRHNIVNVGLPFDKDDVLHRAGGLANKRHKVIYSSRLNDEKQPWLFAELVEKIHAHAECVLTTGADTLRGHEQSITMLEKLQNEGKLRIVTGATKEIYYSELRDSAVQFNCAKQDFVSYTLLEASSLGVTTIAPCYRSFPETLHNPAHTYLPFDMDDAARKVLAVVREPSLICSSDVYGPSLHHHKTLDRICECMNAVIN